MFELFKQYLIDNGILVNNVLNNWKAVRPLMADLFYKDNKTIIDMNRESWHDVVENYTYDLINVTKTNVEGKIVISYNNEIYDTNSNYKKLAKILSDEYGIPNDKVYAKILTYASKDKAPVQDGRTITHNFVRSYFDQAYISYNEYGLLRGNIYNSDIRDIKVSELQNKLYEKCDEAITLEGLEVKKDYITPIMQNILNEIKNAKVTEYRALMKYDASIGYSEEDRNARVKALLRIGKIEASAVNIEMMKHLIWSIKRKMFDKNIPFPVFFTFFSKIMGTGKSYFISDILGYPFRDKVNSEGELAQLFAENDRKALIYGNWLIDFQELTMPENLCHADGSVKESAKNLFKQICTSQQLGGRQLYTDEGAKLRQSAVFCSSTNKHIYQVVHDEDGMRRYWEFDWGIKDKAEIDSDYSAKIQSKMAEIYAMFDENFDDGYYHPKSPYFKQMEDAQERYRYVSFIRQFVNEMRITFIPKYEIGCKTITKRELYDELFNPWQRDEGKDWKLSGMVGALNSSLDVSPVMHEGRLSYFVHMGKDLSDVGLLPDEILECNSVSTSPFKWLVRSI